MCVLLNSCGTFNAYALCCIRKHLMTHWAVHDVFNNWPHPVLSGCHLSLQLLTSLLACTTISIRTAASVVCNQNCIILMLTALCTQPFFKLHQDYQFTGNKWISSINLCKHLSKVQFACRYIPSPLTSIYEWCVDRVNIPASILHQEECYKSVGRSTCISTHIHSSHLFRPSPHSDSRERCTRFMATDRVVRVDKKYSRRRPTIKIGKICGEPGNKWNGRRGAIVYICFVFEKRENKICMTSCLTSSTTSHMTSTHRYSHRLAVTPSQAWVSRYYI